jgi:hypothetical protein
VAFLLDLEALVTDMQSLAGEVARGVAVAHRQRDLAEEKLQAARSLTSLRAAVEEFGQPMALPTVGRDMGAVHPWVPAEDYTVIATDGSQIEPNYHHIAPWYVINGGCAVFRYGAPDGRDRCRLSSHPQLKPPRRGEPDPLPESGERPEDALGTAVGLPVRVEVERLKAELELAARILDEEGDPDRTVLLLDGPLVQWRMIQDLRGEDKKEILALFRGLLDRARDTRTVVAGFISRSRAVEWVTLLRFSMCPEVREKGRLCSACRRSLLGRYAEPPKEAHHRDLAGLRDVELASRLLGDQKGARTEVVELRSDPWTEIVGGSGGAAGFFYINTGPEVARVEVPQWVWEDTELMDRLHSVVWDQCDSGNGYPMVLSEAHEAAVVRASDRETFYILTERVLGEHAVDQVTTSAKALSKRRPQA